MKKKKAELQDRKPFSNEEASQERKKDKEKELPIFLECKKPWYLKVDYPLIKKSSKKMKEKAMMATQSDNKEFSSDEEAQEEVNLCLTAKEEEIKFKTQFDFSFDELQEAFYDLIIELKKLSLKNKNLKISNQTFIKEKEELLKEKEYVLKENQDSKKKVEKFKLIDEKFIYGSKKL